MPRMTRVLAVGFGRKHRESSGSGRTEVCKHNMREMFTNRFYNLWNGVPASGITGVECLMRSHPVTYVDTWSEGKRTTDAPEDRMRTVVAVIRKSLRGGELTGSFLH